MNILKNWDFLTASDVSVDALYWRHPEVWWSSIENHREILWRCSYWDWSVVLSLEEVILLMSRSFLNGTFVICIILNVVKYFFTHIFVVNDWFYCITNFLWSITPLQKLASLANILNSLPRCLNFSEWYSEIWKWLFRPIVRILECERIVKCH